MQIKPEYPILYKGIRYGRVENFDCEIMHLMHAETGALEYYEHINIASKKYREENETLAKVQFSKDNIWSTFTITDDEGEIYVLKLHNSLHQEIAKGRIAASDKGLIYIGK